MLSPILVPNCMSIGRCVKFSGNLMFHFAITISFFSKKKILKSLPDKTNECKCNNILLIKLHQREIHNGRFRYGYLPQHRAGTSKNTGICCPLPVSARCSWWQVTFVTHFRYQYNIIGWMGHVYRRSNDSFDQHTSHKHIIIVNVYIGCNAAIVVCCYYIL